MSHIAKMKKILPISISEIALKKILEIREQKQIAEEYHLRLDVKSAGCGIASYVVGFDLVNEKDEVFKLDQLNIVIEKIQVMYLAGKFVDYGESDGETGFIFRDKS